MRIRVTFEKAEERARVIRAIRAQGKKLRVIAKELGLPLGTVGHYLSNRSKAAVRAGLI